MLVLTSKRGEKIRIGPDIELTVVRIGPGNVKLGVTAPPDVNIVRDEITRRPTALELLPAQEPVP